MITKQQFIADAIKSREERLTEALAAVESHDPKSSPESLSHKQIMVLEQMELLSNLRRLRNEFAGDPVPAEGMRDIAAHGQVWNKVS